MKLKFFFLLLMVILLGIYYVLDPGSQSWYLQCPLKYGTGINCPGCGAQRSLHALLHLDFGAAFRLNPLFVVALPYFFMFLLFNINSFKTRFVAIYNVFFGAKAMFSALFLVVVFFIVRNTTMYQDWMIVK